MELTGEWAIKPRGHRFMGHLVLSKVKGHGCTLCPPQYWTVECGPSTHASKHAASNYRVEVASREHPDTVQVTDEQKPVKDNL